MGARPGTVVTVDLGASGRRREQVAALQESVCEAHADSPVDDTDRLLAPSGPDLGHATPPAAAMPDAVAGTGTARAEGVGSARGLPVEVAPAVSARATVGVVLSAGAPLPAGSTTVFSEPGAPLHPLAADLVDGRAHVP